VKKGQGTKQRKTLFEAIHGAAASPEVEAHLAILTQYRKAVVVLCREKATHGERMARLRGETYRGAKRRGCTS